MYTRKIPIKSDCSIEKTLLLISGKWKPAILSELLRTDSIRLKDIQQGLPEASKRALTKQLGEMLEDGLIQKHDYGEYPRKTEYSITPLGRGLAPVFKAMSDFGDQL